MKEHSTQAFLMDLQARITQGIEALDEKSFLVDHWRKPQGETLQGEGITKILEDGTVFERAGCGYSHVTGPSLPPSATQHRPELAGLPFEAMGVSLVFHPKNPHAPTVHMNVRSIQVKDRQGQVVSWYGGGLDLTPIYGYEEDAIHFHKICRDAVQPFGTDLYPRFKTWCDEYFYLKHRQEPRGIGACFLMIFQSWARKRIRPCGCL